jgi:hypothetical protein
LHPSERPEVHREGVPIPALRRSSDLGAESETSNLLPFGIYCVIAGAICILIFS